MLVVKSANNQENAINFLSKNNLALKIENINNLNCDTFIKMLNKITEDKNWLNEFNINSSKLFDSLGTNRVVRKWVLNEK